MTTAITQMTEVVFLVGFTGICVSVGFIMLAIAHTAKFLKDKRTKYGYVLLASFFVLMGFASFYLTTELAIPQTIQNHSRNFIDDFNKSKAYYEIIYNSGELDAFSEKVEYNELVGSYNFQLEKALRIEPEVFTENMDPRIYDLEPIKTFE